MSKRIRIISKGIEKKEVLGNLCCFDFVKGKEDTVSTSQAEEVTEKNNSRVEQNQSSK